VSGTTTNAEILLQFNAGIDLDAATAGIALECGGSTVATTAAVLDDKRVVRVTVPGGYPASSSCSITVTTALTDVFGGPLPDDVTIAFMTAAS
jgi:hypothetical protein